MEQGADIGTQLVTAATGALSGGTAAVVGVAAVVLGLAGCVKIFHVVKSAMDR